jgi:hypothetical protein
METICASSGVKLVVRFPGWIAGRFDHFGLSWFDEGAIA